MTLDDLVARLRARRCGSGWIARCPAHDDREASLSIRQSDSSGKVLLHCFAGCSFESIFAALGGRKLSNQIDNSPHSPKLLSESERTKIAERIWHQTKPAAGTLVETYLRSRGITLPIPRSIRFHAELKHPAGPFVRAAMVAGVQDCHGNFLAIHRTWFDAGAAKTILEPAKAALGPIGGGAVRFAKAAETIALAEGIETALSIQQATCIPTWATLGTSNLASVELPDGVHEVIIAADADEPGEDAAYKAAQRLLSQGRIVRIARPEPGRDFNDYLKSKHA